MARMIKAGKFDKVVEVQKLSIQGNGRDWQTLKQVRASVEPLQGREYFSGPFQLGENITRVRIRYQPDLLIDRKMRLKYGERILSIYSVIDSREQHKEIQLMCKEGEAYANY
ncbi:phage head closure protein [Haemophilus parahaemolyticus]|uniref:Head-tail adaptor protein n=1 Tax=Haemophilus parahaemolyticus TaxID=735 RepID=A0A369Z3Y9_HAEPH|nr:phage head closure protein [Haemophilus parahaemolyticus]RDE99659.1 head-tail adaptor protein [Haemophilus parahaemolyticus]